MRPLGNLRIAVLALVLLGSFVVRAGAGTMGEAKMGMMGETRTGELTGTGGHHAAGTVVLSTGDNGAVLTLSDLKVDKVPDGRVYLAKDADLRQGVELGKLKQFSGTVSYPVPPGIDPGAFNSVVIWCEKFSVEIGRATLAGEKM